MTKRARTIAAGTVFGALAVCGWFVAATAPFSVESSVFTFSTAGALLLVSAVLPRANRRLLESSRAPSPSPAGASESYGRAGGAHAAGLGDHGRAEVMRDDSLRLRGVFAWLVSGSLLVGVELWELFHSPRSLYPTLSSITNEVLGPGHRVARAAAFVCWGACGVFVASRPKPH